MSLPVDMSVASGLNALAHCVDSMWAPHADPVNAALAAEGIRSLRAGLPRVVADPMDLDGREHALYAAYLSAAAFASAGSGLHHKICHVLGGKYNLPHAQTHATVLPYVLAFNGPAAPAAEQRIAGRASAAGQRAGRAGRARRELDAPRALADYGFTEDPIAEAAEAILPSVPASNPRPVTAADLRALLRAAWSGADPEDVPSENRTKSSFRTELVSPGQQAFFGPARRTGSASPVRHTRFCSFSPGLPQEPPCVLAFSHPAARWPEPSGCWRCRRPPPRTPPAAQAAAEHLGQEQLRLRHPGALHRHPEGEGGRGHGHVLRHPGRRQGHPGDHRGGQRRGKFYPGYRLTKTTSSPPCSRATAGRARKASLTVAATAG